jgi:uncharacterized ferredoxin-like protein
MKKNLLRAAAFIIIAVSVNSCEGLNCKTCKKVYYDQSGTFLREDAEAEYCDVELLAIDGKTIDLGALGSAKWECR